MLLITSGTVRHEVEAIGTVSVPTGSWNYHPEQLWNPFGEWMRIAPYVPTPVPDLTIILNRLIDRTGWSNRKVAEVVGTTHPTIKAIKSGREPERRPQLGEALFKTAEVVEKISKLARNDQTVLRAVLKSHGKDDKTPLQLLAAGEYAKAYLRALDLLNGERVAVNLFDARQVRRPSEDIGLIFDDRDD